MVSLRSIFLMEQRCLTYGEPEIDRKFKSVI
jgi:hypothetical protein